MSVTINPRGIEYMCPFCVTPWKCNGPHIEPEDFERVQGYFDAEWDHALDEAVRQILFECGHTKYEGCRPCIHDEIAERVEKLRRQT